MEGEQNSQYGYHLWLSICTSYQLSMLHCKFDKVLFKSSQEGFAWMLHQWHNFLQNLGDKMKHHDISLSLCHFNFIHTKSNLSMTNSLHKLS